MSERHLDRRQFQQLTAAAVGGLMMGAALGCGDAAQPVQTADNTTAASDKHLCRGLNDCKDLGKSGKNDCRGQGDCATAAHHDCGGHNTCKGLGGCGADAGANDCKGKGGCHVPLMDSAWTTVRTRMEEKWKSANADFAPVPAEKM